MSPYPIYNMEDWGEAKIKAESIPIKKRIKQESLADQTKTLCAVRFGLTVHYISITIYNEEFDPGSG